MWDKIKLFLAALLLVASLAFVSSDFGINFWLRALASVASLGISLVCFFTTERGKRFLHGIDAIRQELYKISWSSRKQVLQLLLYVAIVVLVVAIFLWLVDTLFLWVMRELIF